MGRLARLRQGFGEVKGDWGNWGTDGGGEEGKGVIWFMTAEVDEKPSGLFAIVPHPQPQVESRAEIVLAVMNEYVTSKIETLPGGGSRRVIRDPDGTSHVVEEYDAKGDLASWELKVPEK